MYIQDVSDIKTYRYPSETLATIGYKYVLETPPSIFNPNNGVDNNHITKAKVSRIYIYISDSNNIYPTSIICIIQSLLVIGGDLSDERGI